MRDPSTKAFKQGFLRNLLLSLNSCRRNGEHEMSLQERKRAMRSSADAGGARWPRALLLASWSSSSPLPGKTRRKKMARRRCRKRRSSTCSSSVISSSCEIASRLVRRRTKVLRGMVPGGELLADGASLLREAMDYVVHLRAQVAVLRRVSEAMRRDPKLRAAGAVAPNAQLNRG